MTYHNVLTTHGRERNIMAKEPALIVGALASIIVAVGAHFDIVIDDASVGAILAPLVSSVLIRAKVTPA